MTPIALLLALAAASVALVTDLRSRRIPNWLTGGSLVLGLVVNVVGAGLEGLLMAVAGGALGFAMLILFYAVGGVGAGDVKLLAALGTLLGPMYLLGVALYGAIFGGIMSLVILAHRGTLSLAVHQLFVMRTIPSKSGAKAPYAVAIAAGVYVAILPALLHQFAIR